MPRGEGFIFNNQFQTAMDEKDAILSERIISDISGVLSVSDLSGEGFRDRLKQRLSSLESVSGECPLSLVLTDPKGWIVFCNDRTTRIFGFSREEMDSKRLQELWDPSLWGIPESLFADLNKGLTPRFDGNIVMQGKAGNSIESSIAIHPLRNKGKTGHFLFIIHTLSGTSKSPPEPSANGSAAEASFVGGNPKTPWLDEVIEEDKGPVTEDPGWDEEIEEILVDGSSFVDQPVYDRFPPVPVGFPRLDGNRFLQNIIDLGASDLHIKVGFPPIFRMENLQLHVAGNMEPLEEKSVASFIENLLGSELFNELNAGREIDFAHAMPNGERFRMNAFLSMGSPSLSVRHIKSAIPTPTQLGVPWVLRKLARSTSGLIIVTGPTGSGKSTTLASLIEEINFHKNVHIVTLEDPIEYVFHPKKALINQREIGKDSRSFGHALTKVLRQDPDVIMIGEMRDLETISLAVTAAETGHLVLATLHTRDAASAIERIVDVFPGVQQEQIKAELSNTLLGICCQQLIPKTGGGRILATEMLVGTSAVRNRIRTGGAHHLRNIIMTTPKDGMYTLEQNLATLVKERLISYETAVGHCLDVKDLNRFLEVSRTPLQDSRKD
jgi:twitching motility protein PilT